MIITNLRDTRIEPTWAPSAWIITDGTQEATLTVMWEWGKGTELYKKPPILPGETQGWTFLAYPIDKGWWVKAIEWTSKLTGTHRYELPKPNMSLREFNYVDCDNQ